MRGLQGFDPMAASKPRLYRISFHNQNQVYEIFAREVSHGAMIGFVEVGKLVFGERSTVVLDPGEEKLKTEFAGVERFFIPIHAVIRIDEVNKPGPMRVMPGGEGSKVTHLPPVYNFGGESKK
jgi:hypothetical protein